MAIFCMKALRSPYFAPPGDRLFDLLSHKLRLGDRNSLGNDPANSQSFFFYLFTSIINEVEICTIFQEGGHG